MSRLDFNLDPQVSAPRDAEPREISGQQLTGRVVLDNTNFEHCRFRRAVLVYSGGAPPSLQNCTFQGVTFQFEGAAGRTLALLQAMSAASSGFRDIFKASFPKLFAH